MDWKTIGDYVLLIGLLVTMIAMFNQINTVWDRMQAETNARFDRMQAETNVRFDAVNARFDAVQVENSRQHDDLNRRFDEMFESFTLSRGGFPASKVVLMHRVPGPPSKHAISLPSGRSAFPTWGSQGGVSSVSPHRLRPKKADSKLAVGRSVDLRREIAHLQQRRGFQRPAKFTYNALIGS